MTFSILCSFIYKYFLEIVLFLNYKVSGIMSVEVVQTSLAENRCGNKRQEDSVIAIVNMHQTE